MSGLIENLDLQPSLEDYKKAFSRLNENKTENQLRTHYESCRDRAAEQLIKHPFWIELMSVIQDWDALYKMETGAESLYKGSFSEQSKLNKKQWDSVYQKAYRKNVLNNVNWPNEPESGWVAADSWFRHLGDILRTQFICRYIDGVKFIADKLEFLAKKHNLVVANKMQATNEGYYAGHVDISFEFNIMDMGFNPVPIVGRVEFQVTTQLKEVVKQLLHIHYESKRIEKTHNDESVWQWDYKKPSFEANYLGHVMHYLEAQILKLRDQHHVSR
jgi:hypothetical protein